MSESKNHFKLTAIFLTVFTWFMILFDSQLKLGCQDDWGWWKTAKNWKPSKAFRPNMCQRIKLNILNKVFKFKFFGTIIITLTYIFRYYICIYIYHGGR